MRIRREVAKLCRLRKLVIIPIVIVSLGTLSGHFKGYVEGLEMRQLTSLLKKSCIFGTVKVMRRRLDT